PVEGMGLVMGASWDSLFAAAGMNGPKAGAAKVPAAPRIICRRDREEYLMRRSFLGQRNCCARFGMSSDLSRHRLGRHREMPVLRHPFELAPRRFCPGL